jgi:1,4-dihydroxy-2-naphthoate octaprenyltransferase
MDTLPFLMTVAVSLFAGQYSVGLALSYRGLGEAVIFSTGLLTPIAFIALTGRVEVGPFFVGAMLGLFFAGVNLNSNHADYPYDRAAGRGTLAVRIGLEAHRMCSVVLFTMFWLCFIGALVTSALPPYAIGMVVLVRRHVRQLTLLFAGKPLEARKVGFITLRLLMASVLTCIVIEQILTTL